jgi:Fur family transcriptional regulator, peroxide stress response regulator
MDPKDRFKQIVDKLKENNHRITPQRLAVVKILAKSEGHPSVENIYEQVKKKFPTTSLATVYKTLSLVKELGEVLELAFADNSNRYDGNKPFPHPHLICISCKKIIDPEFKNINGFIEKLAHDTDFEIINHRLDFFGYCPDCQVNRN